MHVLASGWHKMDVLDIVKKGTKVLANVRDGMEVLASCGSDSMLWLEGGMESMF
jgi:hypothetical protein